MGRVQTRCLQVTLYSVFLLSVQACYHLQPTEEPIATLFYPGAQHADAAVEDLVVLLPGIYSYAEDFQRKQFIDVVQASWSGVDVLAVNAHYAYYSSRTLLHRLKEDVVEPAFENGYQRTHFAGISLGGYGTLLYMREYPNDVTSAILLAPYLGGSQHYSYLLTVDEIAPAAEDEANIWPWLESLAPERCARIYLGYGRFDSYAESHRLLADYLLPSNVMVVDGGHRWVTWQTLWPGLLARAQRRELRAAN